VLQVNQYKISVFLGFYAAWSGNTVPTFRDNLSVPKNADLIDIAAKNLKPRINLDNYFITEFVRIPVSAWSKAWVCGLSIAGIVCANPAWGVNVCVL